MAIGNPVSNTSSSVASKTSSVIATAGQTLFTVSGGYVTNHISVFRNGIRLVDSRDYEARNGATVTLLAAATVGDVIEFHVFDTFSVADAVTNQGGTIFGDLTVEGSIGDITANNVTGVAATFTGAVSVGGVLTYEDVTNIDSVGIITARTDLSIADKIIHTGDTNTAIRFPAADTVTVETAGSECLRIESSGRVKVKAGRLLVQDSSSGNSDTDGLALFSISNTGYLWNYENSPLLIATNGTERMRIDSSGNLMIGTTTAATNARVTVRASAPQLSLYATPGWTSRLTLGDTDDYDIGKIEYANSDNSMRFTTNASERLRIDSSGRLLLNGGTDVRIELGTTGTTGTNDRNHLRGDGSSLKYNTCSGGLHIFEQNGSERMRIDSSGNIGINNTNPQYALVVGSGTDDTLNVDTLAAGSGVVLRSYDDGKTDYEPLGIAAEYINFYTRTGVNSSAERMRIDSSGNMGLGTSSPAATLHVKSDSGVKIHASSANTTAVLELAGTRTLGAAAVNISKIKSIPENPTGNLDDTSLAFETRSQANQMQEAMRIDSSGRLLIGTTVAYSSDDSFVIQKTDAGGRIGLQHSSTGQVTAGEELGRVSFYSNDGDLNPSASIIAAADLDHAAGDKPGRLVFSTTADGASTPTERMRISSSGGATFTADAIIHSVTVGRGAGAVSTNTAVGNSALNLNTSGGNNVAVGRNCLGSNNTGSSNTAMGHNALYANTVSNNTACGNDALSANTTGGTNTAVGDAAATTNTTGFQLTAVGHASLYSNTIGYANAAVGYLALQDNNTGYHNAAMGAQCLLNVTSGIRNTGVGYNVGSVLTTGSYNVYLGAYAQASAAGITFETVIGHNLTGKGTHTAYIGGQNGAYNQANATTWATTSDRRIKKNIVDNNEGLSLINQIAVKNFEYKTVEEIEADAEVPATDAVPTTGSQLGVIAQELQEVRSSWVTTRGNGTLSVTGAHEIVWHLVNAVKELSAKNTALEARIETLETEVSALKAG